MACHIRKTHCEKFHFPICSAQSIGENKRQQKEQTSMINTEANRTPLLRTGSIENNAMNAFDELVSSHVSLDDLNEVRNTLVRYATFREGMLTSVESMRATRRRRSSPKMNDGGNALKDGAVDDFDGYVDEMVEDWDGESMASVEEMTWGGSCRDVAMIRPFSSNNISTHSMHESKQNRVRYELYRLLSSCKIGRSEMDRTEKMVRRIARCDTTLDILGCKSWMKDGVLPFFGLTIFKQFDNFSTVAHLEGSKLSHFFKYVTTKYHEHPYHNAEHAADVLYTMYCLLQGTELGKELTDLQKYIMLVVAVLHDIEHLGITNRYIKDSNHPLWEEYGCCGSPLEAMHLSISLATLQDKRFGLLEGIDKNDAIQVAALVPKLIEATDLARQKDVIQNFKNSRKSIVHMEKQHPLACLAIHAADLGSSSKLFVIHRQWALRINEEFANEGNATKKKDTIFNTSMSSNNNVDTHEELSKISKVQVGFITNLVVPVFQALHVDGKIDLSDYIFNINANLDVWKSMHSV